MCGDCEYTQLGTEDVAVYVYILNVHQEIAFEHMYAVHAMFTQSLYISSFYLQKSACFI